MCSSYQHIASQLQADLPNTLCYNVQHSFKPLSFTASVMVTSLRMALWRDTTGGEASCCTVGPWGEGEKSKPCPLTCAQNLFPWLSRHGDQHPEVHLPRLVPDSLCRPVCGSLWTTALSAYPCHWLLVTCTLHVCQRAASCFPGDGKQLQLGKYQQMSLPSEGLATSSAAWSEAQPWGEGPFESVLPLILSLSPRVQHRGSLYLISEFNYSLY